MYEGLASLLRMRGQGLTRDPISNMPKKYKIQDLIPIMAEQAFPPAPMPPQMSEPTFVYQSDGGQMVDGDDYVVDAYTVAALGNGSSDAGARVLDQTLPEVSNMDGSYVGMVESSQGDGMSDNVSFNVQNGGEIDGAKISPDEYIIDKEQVAAIGGGDINEGTQNLNMLREEIRQQTYGSPEQPNQIAAGKVLSEFF
jgi:hypothetical protein